MAGEDVAAQVKNDLLFLHESFWQDQMQGVLLYGSVARIEAGPRSDIDLCIVAPEAGVEGIAKF
jgi:predicted nucleotidyltransferase